MKMLCSFSWKTHTEKLCIRHQDVEGVAYQWQSGLPVSVENRNYVLLNAETVRLKFSVRGKNENKVYHMYITV